MPKVTLIITLEVDVEDPELLEDFVNDAVVGGELEDALAEYQNRWAYSLVGVDTPPITFYEFPWEITHQEVRMLRHSRWVLREHALLSWARDILRRYSDAEAESCANEIQEFLVEEIDFLIERAPNAEVEELLKSVVAEEG